MAEYATSLRVAHANAAQAQDIQMCSPDQESSDPGVPNSCQVGRRCVQGKAYAEPVHHFPATSIGNATAAADAIAPIPAHEGQHLSAASTLGNACRPGHTQSLIICIPTLQALQERALGKDMHSSFASAQYYELARRTYISSCGDCGMKASFGTVL